MTFSLPSGIFTQHNEIADYFITGLGTVCQLIYPKKTVACSNCYPDSITKRSSGRYKSGGPIPFSNGQICPWCQGEGYFYEEVTENVTLRIYWQFKNWANLDPQVYKNNTVCEVRGFMTDMPKLMRAEFLKINTATESYQLGLYQRMGEMVPYGLGSQRYMVGMWQKSN